MLIYSHPFIRYLPGRIRDTGVSCSFYTFNHRRFYTHQRSSVNHYDVLGLNPKATNQEIKSAFYQLSKKHHPDVNQNDNDAAKKFATISNAYDVLGDPVKRRDYDRELSQTSSYAEAPTYNPMSSYAQRARAHRASAARYAYTSTSSHTYTSGSEKTDDGFANSRSTQHGSYDRSQYDEQFGRFRGAPPEGYWNKADFEEFYRVHYSDYASWQRAKRKKKQRAEEQYEENGETTPPSRSWTRWTWEDLTTYLIWLSLGLFGFFTSNFVQEMHFQQPTDEFPSRFFKIPRSSNSRFYGYASEKS